MSLRKENDMTVRTLTITQTPDWRAGLRAAGKATVRGRYAGEVLNFENPAQFFGQLTERRWSWCVPRRAGAHCPCVNWRGWWSATCVACTTMWWR